MPYEDEDAFVRGQKTKLVLAIVLGVIAAYGGAFAGCF
jgi:hypothetical protein